MSTAAAASVPAEKEGSKKLVTAGPHAQKMVGIWLFGSAAWVFSMVILGGATRLTRSGLSMTETDWKFTGSLPPLSDEEWMVEFDNYKQSPEYKRIFPQGRSDADTQMFLLKWLEELQIFQNVNPEPQLKVQKLDDLFSLRMEHSLGLYRMPTMRLHQLDVILSLHCST